MELQKKADRIEECFNEIIRILEQDFGGTKGGLEHNVAKLQDRREIIRGYVNKVLKYANK